MGAVVGKGWLGLEALALFFDMVMVLIWKLAWANIFEKFLAASLEYSVESSLVY